jgi:hypothetical protein
MATSSPSRCDESRPAHHRGGADRQPPIEFEQQPRRLSADGQGVEVWGAASDSTPIPRTSASRAELIETANHYHGPRERRQGYLHRRLRASKTRWTLRGGTQPPAKQFEEGLKELSTRARPSLRGGGSQRGIVFAFGFWTTTASIDLAAGELFRIEGGRSGASRRYSIARRSMFGLSTSRACPVRSDAVTTRVDYIVGIGFCGRRGAARLSEDPRTRIVAELVRPTGIHQPMPLAFPRWRGRIGTGQYKTERAAAPAGSLIIRVAGRWAAPRRSTR